jgi:replicative superfamily II helicase
VRARSLYNSGYRSLKDIRGATVEGLAKVPSIGKAIARDIKSQVMGDKIVI